MPSKNQTIAKIVSASTWDQRVAQVRLVAQNHGLAEHAAIYADVARQAYVPYLAPDFAYINMLPAYARGLFNAAYALADEGTAGFTRVSITELADLLVEKPESLLAFRVIVGQTRNELAQSVSLVATALGVRSVGEGKIKSMELEGSPTTADQAQLLAITITQIVEGTMFGEPPGADVHSKQSLQIDTAHGWDSVRPLAAHGVSYADFLHQRMVGGAFRQLLDATSEKRGDQIEQAVQSLFDENGISYLRTGSQDQAEIQKRFEIYVTPAPDFVVYDSSDNLRAMLECKLVNDGGTARDKAPRFERLRAECLRLGGIPLFAVLSGIGWKRVNDTLGPVIRDTDGRVFTLSTLPEMLTVAPFPTLLTS